MQVIDLQQFKHYFYTVYSKHRCLISQRNTKTYSKVHVLADQRVTIRLVKILFLYGENTILPISVPGLLEKHML